MKRRIIDDQPHDAKSKKEDPLIDMLIMLEQCSSIVDYAIKLELRRFGVNIPQVKILTMLSREDRPLTIDEISNWSLREFNSVSTLINKMEKDGLIKKTKRNGDTKTYITLTKEGANLYNHEITERSIHLIFNSLSADERTQLHDLLKKVRDITRDILGIDFKPPFLP